MEFDNIIKLINSVSTSDLTSFVYEEEGLRIKMEADKVKIEEPVIWKKEVKQVSTEGNTEVIETEGNLVKSPLVGIYYSAPSEDAANFVSVGDVVKKGQTLAIVEAMKLMNDIESEFDGVVVEILVENGQSVEYGQPMFKIA